VTTSPRHPMWVKRYAELYQTNKVQSRGIKSPRDNNLKTIVQAVTYAAWNSLNTILAIPSVQIARQTYKKLKELFPNTHVGYVGDGHHDISTQLTISTFNSLKSCALEKCELLLVDEMHRCTSNTFQEALQAMTPRRVFGFSATPEKLSNGADKLLVGIFGEKIIDFPYEEAQAQGGVVPITVYMVRMPETYQLSGYRTYQAKKKYGIKQSSRRNKLAAEVCRLIPPDWQAIIFVNEVAGHMLHFMEHAEADIRWVHREQDEEKAGSFALKPKEQNAVIKAFENNEFKKLIATNALSAGVDIPNCRAVIQLGGGSSTQEILQEALRCSRILTPEQMEQYGLPPKDHAVVVDFYDRHDDSLESQSRTRVDLYRSQGWDVKFVNSPAEITW